MTTPSQQHRRELERRRIAAGRMFNEGKTQYAVARRFGVSTAATNKWFTAWKKEGEDGLLSKGHPGFVSQYTAEKKKALKKIILKRPSLWGFQTDFWTIERIREVAKRQLGITLKTKRTWQTIIELGFSVQKPEKRAKERNEAAVTDWKLTTFPRLKKMGA